MEYIKVYFKNPTVLVFSAVYVSAFVIALSKSPLNALVFLGMNIAMLFLIWLIIELTKEVQVPNFEIRSPGWELAFGLLIIVFFELHVLLPRLEFGDKWNFGSILVKILILVVLPFIFLKLRKNRLSSMGLTTIDWKKNIKAAFIVLIAMAIPSAFYSNTASLILGGKFSSSSSWISYIIYLLSSYVWIFRGILLQSIYTK